MTPRSDRIDYIGEAHSLQQRLLAEHTFSADQAIALMTVNVELAAVEQQRVANLIAAASLEAKGIDGSVHGFDAASLIPLIGEGLGL